MCPFQEAIKFLSRLNSLVELETNRLLQNPATDFTTCVKRLLLTDLFDINIEFYVKLIQPFFPENRAFADFWRP